MAIELQRKDEVVSSGYGRLRFVVASYLNGEYKFRINSLKSLVYAILAQTYQDFEIYIHHDGPLEDNSIKEDIEKIDSRIKFIVTNERRGCWGFYDRRDVALMEPVSDWIIFTNDDNYYVPKFAEAMLDVLVEYNKEMVFCNLVHNGMSYLVLDTEVRLGGIDLGCYILSSNIVKQVPWTDFSQSADGVYAIEVAKITKPVKLENIMFIHN